MKFGHPLWKIAQSQAGLFTSRQAIQAGIDARNHAYHLSAGNWSRVAKGLYQLNILSDRSKWRDLFLFQLWARNRQGDLVGAFSHSTALFVMGILSSYPEEFYLTVPGNFYRISHKPDKLFLYFKNLSATDRIKKDNLYVTSPRRTFQDVIISGLYHPEQIKQYLKQAIDKNILSFSEIKNLSIPESFEQTFSAILFELQ